MDSENFDEVIVGTYEEFLLGFRIIPTENGCYEFQPTFTNHAHNGRIKQVVLNGNYLVSGGTDEFIKIFNLNSRVEVGHILPHTGTVSCLQFHKSGYLFSGSEDGIIGIFKKGKWNLEKSLKGHKAGVNDLAIHPSGKLGLSVSKDKTMVTWDLMKGKKVYAIGLKRVGEYIYWSLDGNFYLIIAKNIMDIYSVENGNIVQSIDFKENIYCICYLTDELIALGGEKKEIIIFNVILQKKVVEWKAHENRTKTLHLIETRDENFKHIISASSDGFVKIWLVNLLSLEETPKLVGKLNTQCRIICLAIRLKENKHTLPECEHLEEELITNALKIRKEHLERRSKFRNKTKVQNKNKNTISHQSNSSLPENNKDQIETIENGEETGHQLYFKKKVQTSKAISEDPLITKKIKLKFKVKKLKKKDNLRNIKNKVLMKSKNKFKVTKI